MIVQDLPVSELQSLDEFIEAVNGIKIARKSYSPPLLFRGQSDSSWALETTLDRFASQRVDLQSYLDYLQRAAKPFSALSTKSFSVPYVEVKEDLIGIFRCEELAEFLIYLRHIGFPSPLLDWTTSPFIAAFFALEGASRRRTEKNPIAIIFLLDQNNGSAHWEGEAHLRILGPDVVGHPRHHLQQAQYTIAIQSTDDPFKLWMVPHEEAIGASVPEPLIRKFTLPAEVRDDALRQLDSMNINSYSLFQHGCIRTGMGYATSNFT